ncbi:MAG: GNAT family N-acetyltransferase [Clostridia bacterium]|nr:GNAT family N-acetyltransferase [Clostridia bacterium]
MKIRKWLFKDNLVIAKIEKECFKDPWTMQMISDTFMLDNFLGFVAEEDGEIVGYIALTYCLEEAEINIIAVSEKFRKKGIASELLKKTQTALLKLGVKKLFWKLEEATNRLKAYMKRMGLPI